MNDAIWRRAAGFVGFGLQIATYIGGGADTQLRCAKGNTSRKYIFLIFRGNKISNKLAKADLQISLLEVGLVP